MLAFYTVDSNLFATMSCSICAIFILRQILTGRNIPTWVSLLKYIAVCCLSITFIVVPTVLAPMRGAIIAIVPTITYAMIMLLLNVAKLIEGPYPFLRVYNQPIYMSFFWFIVIGGGAYVIALLWGLLIHGDTNRSSCDSNKK